MRIILSSASGGYARDTRSNGMTDTMSMGNHDLMYAQKFSEQSLMVVPPIWRHRNMDRTMSTVKTRSTIRLRMNSGEATRGRRVASTRAISYGVTRAVKMRAVWGYGGVSGGERQAAAALRHSPS